eukprot:jgi/Ulvmu1/9415/UM051_0043.1
MMPAFFSATMRTELLVWVVHVQNAAGDSRIGLDKVYYVQGLSYTGSAQGPLYHELIRLMITVSCGCKGLTQATAALPSGTRCLLRRLHLCVWDRTSGIVRVYGIDMTTRQHRQVGAWTSAAVISSADHGVLCGLLTTCSWLP